jgi:hypothetical protein
MALAGAFLVAFGWGVSPTEAHTIIIRKVTNPTGATATFTFNIPFFSHPFQVTLSDGGRWEGPLGLPVGTYAITEVPTPGWDLTSNACSDGISTADAIAFQGETITCIFVNTQRGSATVVKTVSGSTPGAGFTFQIRQGASASDPGSVIATGITDASGTTAFGGATFSAGTYQFCEAGVPAGWTSSLSSDPSAFTPAGPDNSVICVPFTLDPGETEQFVADNTPPPGGPARTIGFWKNWSSCTGGNQAAVLDDQTLASFPGGGLLVGDLFVADCLTAVRILDKSDVGTDAKRARDAAYGLAAQLLAAQLNVQAGAATCSTTTQAIVDGQALLDTINFTGTGSYLPPDVTGTAASQRAAALLLGATLDAYNNNELCGP